MPFTTNHAFAIAVYMEVNMPLINLTVYITADRCIVNTRPLGVLGNAVPTASLLFNVKNG